MAGFAPQVLDERTVGYQCDCSEERTKGMLLSLGRRELVKMAGRRTPTAKWCATSATAGISTT